MAMVQAVADGLIDVISSFHTPADEESKRLPFEEAASGAVGLQTLLPAAMRLYHAGAVSLPQLWRALSLNPANRLGLAQGRLTRGRPRRPCAVRPRCAVSAGPLQTAVEIQEHSV